MVKSQTHSCNTFGDIKLQTYRQKEMHKSPPCISADELKNQQMFHVFQIELTNLCTGQSMVVSQAFSLVASVKQIYSVLGCIWDCTWQAFCTDPVSPS